MRYAACPDQHYDQVTGACAQVVFVPPPTMFPELSVADGLLIGGAMFTAFGVAWIGKLFFRASRSI